MKSEKVKSEMTATRDNREDRVKTENGNGDKETGMSSFYLG